MAPRGPGVRSRCSALCNARRVNFSRVIPTGRRVCMGARPRLIAVAADARLESARLAADPRVPLRGLNSRSKGPIEDRGEPGNLFCQRFPLGWPCLREPGSDDLVVG